MPLLMAASMVYAFRAGTFVRPLTTADDFTAVRGGCGVACLFWSGILPLIYALRRSAVSPREEPAKLCQLIAGILTGEGSNLDANRSWIQDVARL